MDIATGLASIGKYIAGKEQPRKSITHNNRIKRAEINGDNVYQSRNVGLNRRLVKNKANLRYLKSANPIKSGIVPNF